MTDDNEHIAECIKHFFWFIIILGIIITEVVLIFMPEKYHYKYEGNVVKVEPTLYRNEFKYTYIDAVTNDTMSITQNGMFDEGYYTQRCADKKVYTYRWWTSSIVWLLPAIICLIMFHMFVLEIFE